MWYTVMTLRSAKATRLLILIVSSLTASPTDARVLPTPKRVDSDNPHGKRVVELARALNEQYRQLLNSVSTWPIGADRTMRRLARYGQTFRRHDQALARYWNLESQGGGGGRGGARPGAGGFAGSAGPFARGGGGGRGGARPGAGGFAGSAGPFARGGGGRGSGGTFRGANGGGAGIPGESRPGEGGFSWGAGPFAPGGGSPGEQAHQGRIFGQVVQPAPVAQPPFFTVEPTVPHQARGAGGATMALHRHITYSADRELSRVARSVEDLHQDGLFAGPGDRERFLAEASIDWSREMVLFYSYPYGYGQDALTLVALEESASELHVRIRRERLQRRALDGEPPSVAVSIGFAAVVTRSDLRVRFDLDVQEVLLDPSIPLAGAHVSIELQSLESAADGFGWSVGATTDDEGRFEIIGIPEGTHCIRVHADGFADQQVTATTGAASITIEMFEAPPDLEPTDVSMASQGTGQAVELVPAGDSLDDPFSSSPVE